ncbi:MAG: hypothetical protein ACRC2U_10540, partial [Aeromonas sp.]
MYRSSKQPFDCSEQDNDFHNILGIKISKTSPYFLRVSLFLESRWIFDGFSMDFRWFRQVVTRALALSGQIVSDRGALPVREVGYVAKSVAGFVYYRYTGAGSILTPELRAIKAEQGRKGGLIGGKVSKGGGRP